MQIQTFSIVVGTKACNARCPFCVSSMTGFGELPKRGEIELVHFEKACRLAQLAGTTTVLMTGKGEPTLYPGQISEYLQLLASSQFPFIELQTNALDIGWLARDGQAKHAKELTRDMLVRWRRSGLNTIAISVVGIDPEQNRPVYHDDYPDLATTIGYLHEIGFTVRLCVMMQQGSVDTPDALQRVIDFCRANRVEQLTVRPIRKPDQSEDRDASAYVVERGITREQESVIRAWVEQRGRRLLSLMHGAIVYDVGGQNVCLSDCLTNDPSNGDIRTLIFYSDGRLTYDWQYEGAVLLGGVPDSVRVRPSRIRQMDI
ncbi:radical SAM protein [Candidatus Uhrbacteria bacterium]|nr:radical SAM protein [Candidatus Uhrbacteria bacterium]